MFELLSWDEYFLVSTFWNGNFRALVPRNLLAVRPDDSPAAGGLLHAAGEGVGQPGHGARLGLVIVELLGPGTVNDGNNWKSELIT